VKKKKIQGKPGRKEQHLLDPLKSKGGSWEKRGVPEKGKHKKIVGKNWDASLWVHLGRETKNNKKIYA